MRLIDADKLLGLFIESGQKHGSEHGCKLGENWLLDYNDIKAVIDNAPTAKSTLDIWEKIVDYEHCDNVFVEQHGKRYRFIKEKKGKWIEYDDDGLYAGECSCCKWKAVLYESNVLNMNFCPNCGARMEREEDDTEQTER